VLILIDALVGFAVLFGVMYLVAGWRWSDLRDVLLHDAYRSFTFEGDRIPGRAPGLAARTAIRWLSDPDDRRLALVPEVQLRPQLHAPAFDRLLVADCELANSAVFRAR
jgi:hypothetical protein